jgi:ubiquinone/menaquinone biosynthesis C-methylase UbiE
VSIAKLKDDWEELSRLDPVGAITGVVNWSGSFSDWERFFAGGEREIADVMKRAADLRWQGSHGAALDFGCGLGKLTRALSKHFTQVYGVDISEAMTAKAQELLADVTNCRFVTNSRPDLAIFPDHCFDFVYTRLVLQHIPQQQIIRGYIHEFLRVAKPGGLVVFQMPSHIPLIRRVQLRRRIYAVLRSVGVAPTFLFRRLRLAPGMNNFIEEGEIVELLARHRASVLTVVRERMGGGVRSSTYYVGNADPRGVGDRASLEIHAVQSSHHPGGNQNGQ